MSHKNTNGRRDIYVWVQTDRQYTFLSLRMNITTVFTAVSYNIGTSALPDMYVRSPRATGPTQGLRAYILGKA